MTRTVWLLLLLMCVLVAGCKGSQAAGGSAKPPRVTVAYPVSQTVTDYEEFPGRIDAVNNVPIKARVPGYLIEVHFVDGQDVTVGDTLAVIQQDPYDAELKAADAQVRSAESQVASYEAQLVRDHATLELARTTLKRCEASGAGATPLENEQCRAQVNQADAQVRQTDALIKQAKAAVNLAKENFRVAKVKYDFTEVKSPLTGRISRRYVDPGSTISADTTVLTTVVSLDPVYVYFDIDERTMLKLERLSQQTKTPVPWKIGTRTRGRTTGVVAGIGKPEVVDRPGLPAAGLALGGGLPRRLGMPVSIGLADEDGFPHDGVMNFADNVVNQKTGTLRIRGEFDNGNRLLAPGMYCRVQVPVGLPHPAILVKDEALGTDQGRKFLYVLNADDEVVQRDVTVGSLHDGLRVVEGVGLDERVVVDGLQRVHSGTKVTPKLAAMTAEKGTKEPALVTNPAGANEGK
jgi:RND family efflux transporter MFP subunit